MMLALNALHILCFGDSLTAGFTKWGAVFHPYAWNMLDQLEEAFPLTQISTDIQGASGDQVVNGFLYRIDALYKEMETPYDWAIILGGTNDLTVGRSPEDIWMGLKEVYSFPLSNKTKVLALTVTETEASSHELTSRRNKLNSYIVSYQAENYYTFDLHKAFPWNGLSDKRRREVWDDGMHPTEKGYDIIGKLLAKRLNEIISERTMPQVDEPVRAELKARARISTVEA
ncbi:SGNH hydrolase-type esterase domain-containing protein [Bisporella sp. PMI_857]|nr:SGNH hydrolase-type esterase domain-containing protein [Bisporella sp. PMI_857]